MKVLIAMSGGVDSSAAALLIKNSGADCIGATLRLFGTADGSGAAASSAIPTLDENNSCCSSAEAQIAHSIADRLGIEHYIYDLSTHFRELVIDRFIETYRHGGTPNPCIDCNRFIKFDLLLEKARQLGCDKLATGHYARVEYDSNSNRFLLKRAADPKKDQTYVLWALSKEQLSHTLFPLGAYTKPEIRELARAQGFENSDRPDSQDICFVPDGDYARFIDEFTGVKPIPGDFVADGRVVGQHKGITHYTLGQRKNLGVSIGHKIFVTGIDPVSNIIRLGDEPELFSRVLTAHDINLTAVDSVKQPLRVTAKVRYSHREAPATLLQTGEDSLRLEFDEPQRAITRGHSVVIYSDEVVIGGGIID